MGVGVVAYAIPPLGGRKHGQFDQFLRFSQSLEFHSHVCLHALNTLPVLSVRLLTFYRAVHNGGGSIRNLPARGPQTWTL